LPHGPNILATHIVKQTGFYEQASYAIQDTPEFNFTEWTRTASYEPLLMENEGKSGSTMAEIVGHRIF
jgi:hypothetical protein